ncbi:MAG: hypothetical protein KDE19_02635, partial [Caldilineaceae bacterium]|nr:hypothetical protein [Caldilineaceae bacterium]
MTTKIAPRSVTWQRILKLEGYLLVPHELLHVIAHRMIGRDCAYQLGDKWVVKREPCSWREDLFCLLFPLMVTLPIGLTPFVIWFVTYSYARYSAEKYLLVAPPWHPALFVLGFVLLNYAVATSLFDVLF